MPLALFPIQQGGWQLLKQFVSRATGNSSNICGFEFGNVPFNAN